MRAELAGKLSMSSPSRQDRLEDTLTDGVFSALRYLPRGVLLTWLQSVLPTRLHQHLAGDAVEGARFEFWPKLPGGSEPDVTIQVGSLLVVVEAKYGSSFGTGGGRHQLAVEWIQAQRLALADGLAGPVVVAITADLVEPDGIAVARSQIAPAELLFAGLVAEEAVVWCAWQSVAKAIDRAEKLAWKVGDMSVADDVFDLMKRREVRFVYEGFKTADWWVLAAAADAATERVYPVVAEFARELTAQGASRGISWGGSDSGAVWYESKQLSNTEQWHRHYIQLPLFHKVFGSRLHHHCALYVLFTFNQPSIRAGWWFESAKRGGFDQKGDRIATWLRGLDSDLDVSDSIHWRSERAAIDRSELTADWVTKRMSGDGRIRVERFWSPESVTSTAPVLDVLSDLAASLCKDGSVLEGLEAAGIIDRSKVSTPIALHVGESSAGDRE
jgi:hypothetical protein